jgi:hypothetical protein
MSLLSSDLQMAGYYSCYEPQSFPFPFDWAPCFLARAIAS